MISLLESPGRDWNYGNFTLGSAVCSYEWSVMPDRVSTIGTNWRIITSGHKQCSSGFDTGGNIVLSLCKELSWGDGSYSLQVGG